MAIASERHCSLDDCDVAETGACIRGHTDLGDCPHFIADEISKNIEIDNQNLEQSADLPQTVDLINIPYGEDLTTETAIRITAQALTRVIVVAGDVGSGKTTLISAIYEKFLDGPFAGYIFAGSQTLLGLEERCYLGRMESEGIVPDTDRTIPGSMKLLHLKVRVSNLSKHSQDMLFSDISGEDFEMARDSIDFCKQLEVLHRADQCLILIDGDKLRQIDHRQQAFRSGSLLLRSFLDSRMLDSHSFVDILFTKYDLLSSGKEAKESKAFLDYVKDELQKNFSKRLGRLRFQEIAARPVSTKITSAYGIEKLFPFWVEDTHLFNRIQPLPEDKRIIDNEFDKYLERRLPDFKIGI